jgi:hypothetical protein
MNQQNKLSIWATIIILLFFMVIFFGMRDISLKHELSHQKIFKYFNVSSTIHTDWWGFGMNVTVDNINNPNYIDNWQDIAMAQSQQEGKDYVTQATFMYSSLQNLILFSLLLIIIFRSF